MNIHKNTNSGNSGLCQQTNKQTLVVDIFLNWFPYSLATCKIATLGPIVISHQLRRLSKLFNNYCHTWTQLGKPTQLKFQMCSIACPRFQSILVLVYSSSSLFLFQFSLVLVYPSKSPVRNLKGEILRRIWIRFCKDEIECGPESQLVFVKLQPKPKPKARLGVDFVFPLSQEQEQLPHQNIYEGTVSEV